MNKRILTVEDLMKFCQSNNFQHFSAENDDVALCVQIPSKIIMNKKSENYTEGLRPFTAKAYHDKVNLNKSSIKKETLESTLPSATLRPILAHIVVDENGEKDFGSHDFSIEQDENGEEKVIYKEQPVGVIFGENTIEYDKESDVDRAILHGYLYEDYCQDAIDILDRRGSTDCSVELSIRELSYNAKEKVLELEDFYVGGLTLLGNSVKPGMAGSNLTLDSFSKNNNSMFTKSEVDNAKLIETLEKLNNTLSNLNINNNDQKGGNLVSKFEELLNKHNVTEDQIDFEYKNLSDEEMEAKFAEVFGEENTAEGEGNPENGDNPEPTTDGENGTEEKGNEPESQMEETETLVSTLEENAEEKITNETETETEAGENGEITIEEAVKEDTVEEVKENEACGGSSSGSGSKKKKKKNAIESDDEIEKFSKTFELSHDDIRSAIYALLMPYEEADNDWYWVTEVYDDHFIYQDCRGNYFGQKYAKEDNNISFDGERYELFAEFVTASEKAELESMRSNYAAISEKLKSYEKAELDAQKEEIISDAAYAEFAETEGFKAIKSEMENLSVEDLKVKCELEFAKCVKAAKTFSYKEEKPATKKANKIGISATFENSENNEPYGDFFKSLKSTY